MLTAPKPHPREFRDDDMAVARKGNASIPAIAQDFGIREACLRNWSAKVDAEEGRRPGVTASESPELRELRRRNRRLGGLGAPVRAFGREEPADVSDLRSTRNGFGVA